MKNKYLPTTHKNLWVALLCLTSFFTNAQVNYTANDRVIPYDGSFRFGMNMGFYPNWTTEQLGQISAGNPQLGLKGVGVNTARPALYEENLETFGYNALVPTFESFYNLGIRDMTAILGGPTGAHRDYFPYCANKPSQLFSNMYEPIWDGGANGTPVNDNNHYALYVWKTVNMYKKYVRIWEVLNEPDYDDGPTQQWKTDFDLTYGWWRQNPQPCDYNLASPIFHYNRLLRISWEVIKAADPTAYVEIGALGYASFLDAVLRNTDNPTDGSVTPQYPLKAGAYFDLMGYHTYPHLDGSLWTYNIQSDRVLGYHRHSDGAIDSGIIKKQRFFQNVLDRFGYNGTTYPKKPWIITEFNLPRKAFEARYVGSDELQRNSLIKAAVTCYKYNILQMHAYQLGDRATPATAVFEFELMGFYKKLELTQPYNVSVNDEGIAYKTASDLLFGSKFDAARTALLNLPSSIDGGAFRHPNGNYVYVLWAKTRQDYSESASATYSFPTSLNLNQLNKYEWNYGYTNNSSSVAAQNIALTGAPIFLSNAAQTGSSYCTSKGIAPWELWVARVQFNTINNTSDKFKDFATLGFSDYTNLSTTVNRGQSYPLSITAGLSWVGHLPNAYCRVWIDFNKNNIFEANELVLEKTNQSPFTQNILIPTTAATGNTRMRVAVKWGSYATACETFDRGEVEDYILNIQGGTDPCTTDTQPPVFTSCRRDTIVRMAQNQTAIDYVWTNPSATDNCSTPSVSSNAASPLRINDGQQVRIVATARDAAGNTSTCSWTATATRIATGISDLGLTITATPTAYRQWTTHAFRITVQNNSPTGFSNIKITFPFPPKTVGAGAAVTSVGTWQQWCAGGVQCSQWLITGLGANLSATLDIPLYVLDATGTLEATTTLVSATPTDDNPANNAATVRLQPQNAAIQGQLIAQKPTQQNPVVVQKIIPTLTEDIILLELESIVNKTVNFEAINAMGQTVFSEKIGIDKGHNRVSFDVTRLPQGIYFIQIDVGKGRNVPTKFVKL